MKLNKQITRRNTREKFGITTVHKNTIFKRKEEREGEGDREEEKE